MYIFYVDNIYISNYSKLRSFFILIFGTGTVHFGREPEVKELFRSDSVNHSLPITRNLHQDL